MRQKNSPAQKSPGADEWDQQRQKIGPFPLILMGTKFRDGLKEWGLYRIKPGVFARDEIGFGRITDSPQEAVDLIVRGLPPVVKARLQPVSATA
jgi:hypothetical protein